MNGEKLYLCRRKFNLGVCLPTGAELLMFKQKLYEKSEVRF